MENEKHKSIAVESKSPTTTSNMLEKVMHNHGLIVLDTEKHLDTHPMSLVIPAKLSTGQPLGEFSMPLMNGILHVEGQLGQEEVRNLMGSSSLDYDTEKIHFFVFATLNADKETLDENDVFLGNSSCKVAAKVKELACDTVVIHNFATASNHFLDGSEKDSIKAIKRLQAQKASVIVFVENGTKGSALLQSMADVVFDVTKAKNNLDAPVNVACTKHPSFEIDPPKPFCLSLSVNNGKWTVTEEADPDETLDLVITSACRGKTQTEIGEYVGLQQYQVSRLLKRAEDQGLIIRNGRIVRRIK